MDTKKILIVTWITASILGLISYFVVFYTSGNYIVRQNNTTPPISVTSSTAQYPTSSTSTAFGGGIPGSSTSTPSSSTNPSFDSYASNYPSPVVRWTEGKESLAITGASL